MLGDGAGSRAATDSGLGDARIRDDDVVSVSHHPGCGGVTPAVLAGVPVKPLVEDRLAGLEPAALVAL
jgi:hypothetical protein